MDRNCAECGTPVSRRPARAARLERSFCTFAHFVAWRRKHGPRGETHVQHGARYPVDCETCGAALERLPYQVKRHNFCDVACRLEWQRTSGYTDGAKSATWRGGHDEYRGPDWNQQRRLALQRDQHTCRHCGATRRLQVHHVRPFVTFEHYLEANRLPNLVTLCRPCHTQADWDYWRTHPGEARRHPDVARIHTCRKCGQPYPAASHRSLDCDHCCRPADLKRRLAARAGRTPARARPRIGQAAAEAS